MTGKNRERDISLYFHIPFCTKKCPYCHFFVLPNEDRFKTPFVEALLKEFDLRTAQIQDKRIVSIYFGGGTPTKLPPSYYALLLEKVRLSNAEIASDCEITLEANPEDVTLLLMQQFHAIGINRVSLGVQSLVNSELILLGRTHLGQPALEAIDAVYQAGITNISIDLLFELPTQTLTSFDFSLKALKELPITHLSLYNLTFEPHTIFFKKQKQLLPLISPDHERLEMLNRAISYLTSIGLERYEISAFSHPGKESKHNTGYWTARPFLGFGPSAFSYWEGSRFSNTTHFATYLTQLSQDLLPRGFEETLSYPHNIRELLAVELRLARGVDLRQFTAKHGELPLVLKQQIEKLIEQDFLKQENTQLALTTQGQLFYDSVASDLI